tara:strand:- start:1274 stop:1393 length:120 start_codon:yes stop_codon:yes gene_type:complete
MFGFLHWISLKWANWNYEKKEKPIKKQEDKIRVSPVLYI